MSEESVGQSILIDAPVAAIRTHNGLLQAMRRDRAVLLLQHAQLVTLPPDRIVSAADPLVYFPEKGLAAVRLPGASGRAALALIGREGALAAPAYGGAEGPPFVFSCLETVHALAVPREIVFAQSQASRELDRVLNRHQRSLQIQIAWTAQAHAELELIALLARWILMATDRVGPCIRLTHAQFADMIQVRRAGVTVALHTLEGEGAIRSTRGLVTMRDRDRLLRLAGETYWGSADSMPIGMCQSALIHH